MALVLVLAGSFLLVIRKGFTNVEQQVEKLPEATNRQISTTGTGGGGRPLVNKPRVSLRHAVGRARPRFDLPRLIPPHPLLAAGLNPGGND